MFRIRMTLLAGAAALAAGIASAQTVPAESMSKPGTFTSSFSLNTPEWQAAPSKGIATFDSRSGGALGFGLDGQKLSIAAGDLKLSAADMQPLAGLNDMMRFKAGIVSERQAAFDAAFRPGSLASLMTDQIGSAQFVAKATDAAEAMPDLGAFVAERPVNGFGNGTFAQQDAVEILSRAE